MAAATASSSSGATNVENVKRFMNQPDIHNLKLADTNHDFRKNDCAGGLIVTQLTSNISDDPALKEILKKPNFEDLAMVHFFNRLNLYGNIQETTFVNTLDVPAGVNVSNFTKIRLQPRGESSGYSENLRSHVLYITGATSYNEVYVVNDGVKSTVLVNGGAFDGADSVHFVQSIARSSDSATMGPVGNKRYIAKDDEELLYVADSYNQFTGLFEKDHITSRFVLDANYGHLGNNLDKFEQKITGPSGETTISYHGKNAGPSISQLSNLYCGTRRALPKFEADASAVRSTTGAKKGWFLDEKRSGDYRQVLVALRLRELRKKVLFISVDRLAVTLAVLLGVPAGLINGDNTDITLFKSDSIIPYTINPIAGTNIAEYNKRRYVKILERMGTLHRNYTTILNKMVGMRAVINNRYNRLKSERESGKRIYTYTLTEAYDIGSMIHAINTIDREIEELDRMNTVIGTNNAAIDGLLASYGTTDPSSWNAGAFGVLNAIYSSLSVSDDKVEQVLTRLERFHEYSWAPDVNNVRIHTDVLEYNYETSGKVDDLIKRIVSHIPPGSPALRRKGTTRYKYVQSLVLTLYNTYLMRMSDADVAVLLGMTHTDFKTHLIDNPLNDRAADAGFYTALQRIIRTDAVGRIPDVPLRADEASESISTIVNATEEEAVRNNKIQARTSVYHRIQNGIRRLFRSVSQLFDTYSEGARGRQQTGGNRIDSSIEDYYVSVDMLIGECMYLFTEYGNIGIPLPDVVGLTTKIICNVLATYMCFNKMPQMVKDGSYITYWSTIIDAQASFESVSNISGVIVGSGPGSYNNIYGRIRKNIFKKPKDLLNIVLDINVDIDDVVSRLTRHRMPMKTDMGRYDRRPSARYGRDDDDDVRRRDVRDDVRDPRRFRERRGRGVRDPRRPRARGLYYEEESDEEDRGFRYEGTPRDEDRGGGRGYYDDLIEVIDALYETYNPSAATAGLPAAAAASWGTPSHSIWAYGRKSMPSQTKRRIRKCPRGTIRRKGYTTKRGVTVRSSCIKDRGLPGKGKRLFTLKKGELGKYGYSLKQAREKRRVALNKARKEMSHATLVRKVNALAILMKNTHPNYAKRARADVKWLGKTRT